MRDEEAVSAEFQQYQTEMFESLGVYLHYTATGVRYRWNSSGSMSSIPRSSIFEILCLEGLDDVSAVVPKKSYSKEF